jgi:patatin-like phospholipase/acyl hydrolase
MVFLIESLLNDDRIKLFSEMTTTGSRNAASIIGNSSSLDLIQLLQTQLGNLFFDEKKHITGKLGPGFKDDLAMALMLGVYWSNKLRSSNPALVTGQVALIPAYN